jgi:6,7-dimethyl-8-ribityllumazine synthase
MKVNHRFAIVVSKFNAEVTDRLLAGALHEFELNNIQQADIKILGVPGAIEIPLMAKLLAKTNKYSAVICLGCVIRGETDHYETVCQQVSMGCMQVMLECSLPIIFGVLTTENQLQAFERAGGSHGHKGVDAVKTAFAMLREIEKII